MLSPWRSANDRANPKSASLRRHSQFSSKLLGCKQVQCYMCILHSSTSDSGTMKMQKHECIKIFSALMWKVGCCAVSWSVATEKFDIESMSLATEQFLSSKQPGTYLHVAM